MKLEETTNSFENVTNELNETQQQLVQTETEKNQYQKIVQSEHQSVLLTLEEKEDALQISYEKIKDMSKQLNNIEQSHHNLQQDYRNQCNTTADLKATFATELFALKNATDLIQNEQKQYTVTLENMNNVGIRLKKTSDDVKNSLQILEPKLHEVQKMAKDIEERSRKQQTIYLQEDVVKVVEVVDKSPKSQHLVDEEQDNKLHISLQKQNLLRRQVELLVNNAELEPDVLVKQVTQLVYAVGAKQEEARTLTRQMFSHVLEIMALRRAGMESLKGQLQHLMEEEISRNIKTR
jgi:hypothetical protein